MTEPVAVTFLGGLGEIGRNCAVLETGSRRVLLDCGQMFAGDDLPGVDAVLPDFTWLLDQGGVEACMATHAHEDHIGGLPHLLRHIEFPIYGSKFTLRLVHHKLSEAGLVDRTELREVSEGERAMIGPFDCEFLPVTHSVPGGLITAFTTPQGVILHSSDFKLDLTPVDGRRTDLSRIGALATDPGIRLLLADSTNADAPGFSRSEREIGAVLSSVIAEQAGRRVIVGAFASHIHRIQQIAEAAVATGRRLVPLGLSMLRNLRIAREVGVLQIPDHVICAIEDLDQLDEARTLIVCTGSQGEPRAALTQMALGRSKWVELGRNDTVIFSSHPIPGNEAAVAAVRNGMARRGAQVVHSGQFDVHTSGHGKQQELRVLHSVAVPEWFVPVHGEYSHLVAHAALARQMGMPSERVLLCSDGDRIELSADGLAPVGSVGGEHLYVDGTVGDLGPMVLGERRRLGSDGFVTVIVHVDLDRAKLIAGPDVVSRGWVEQPALQSHQAALADAVAADLQAVLGRPEVGIDELTRLIRRAAGRTVDERTRRRPMIIPVVRAG